MRLNQHHIASPAAYAQTLRCQARGFVPDFDPCDGGVRARLLLLLEKPGPGLHSGFVSRDNDTPTAATIRTGMVQAGVLREETVIWNVVPWWNGTTAVRAAELRAGLAELPTLLALLPALRSAVLAGRSAQAAAPLVAKAGLPVFACVHPSPNARAGPASAAAWRELPRIWGDAWIAANAAAEPKPVWHR